MHMFLAAAALAGAGALGAQGQTVFELRPFVGASIPGGAQRETFKTAGVVGLESAFELKPTLHLVGTLGLVPGRHTFLVSDNRVNILTYDVGVEFGGVYPLHRGWEYKPFVGLGAGGRTYWYASSQLRTNSCTSAYGTVGSELQRHEVALRFEGRDNVFCYRSPLAGVGSVTRSDVELSLGLAYHFR